MRWRVHRVRLFDRGDTRYVDRLFCFAVVFGRRDVAMWAARADDANGRAPVGLGQPKRRADTGIFENLHVHKSLDIREPARKFTARSSTPPKAAGKRPCTSLTRIGWSCWRAALCSG